MNQHGKWSERQDLNLPQPFDLATPDSDAPRHNRPSPRPKRPAILTAAALSALALLAGCARPDRYAPLELRGAIDANGNAAVRR